MKQTNIKYIPTGLNYHYCLNRKCNKIIKQTNTSRLLIIALIVWNLILTTGFIIDNIQHPYIPKAEISEMFID